MQLHNQKVFYKIIEQFKSRKILKIMQQNHQ